MNLFELGLLGEQFAGGSPNAVEHELVIISQTAVKEFHPRLHTQLSGVRIKFYEVRFLPAEYVAEPVLESHSLWFRNQRRGALLDSQKDDLDVRSWNEIGPLELALNRESKPWLYEE